MQTSDSITKIAPAFLNAQKVMESAKKGESNPFFKSSYADLSSVLEACKGALNDNGISILQPHMTEFNPVTGEELHYVETILLHESGEYYSSKTKLEIAKKNDPQNFGSAVSYGRRYGLQSLISLPAKDDDGEAAMGRKGKTSFSPKKKAAPKSTPDGQKFRRKKADDKPTTEVEDEI